MRVLVNYSSSTPNFSSGISVYAFRITEALTKCPGHEVFVLTNCAEDLIPPSIKKAASVVYSKNYANESAAFVKNALAVPRLADEIDADVIFTPQPYGLPFGKRASVTVVHDLYRLTHAGLHSIARRLQWNAVFPLSLRRSDMIICVSRATRDDLVRHYPVAEHKTAVVHEAPALPFGIVPADATPIGEPYALMVANLSAPTKNVRLFLESIRLLIQEGTIIPVVLVGKDPNGTVAELCSKTPNARITHMPRVTDQELVTLYKHARCYINCSLAEGFCLPILEAQELGTPVICSDLPVLREVAGEGALFVDPKSASSLANAIRRIFQDNQTTADLSRSALGNANHFSWSRAAKETLLVFEKAIEARRRKQNLSWALAQTE